MIQYNFKRADNEADAMRNLYQIVKYLRDPSDGCPWDREQTPVDMIRDLQGEAYEYIDALSDNDPDHEKEELGDIFLSLFLLGRIHEENGDFSLTDCLNETCEKYIRRHPHVFSNVKALNSEEVLKNWEDIKKNVEGRKEDENNFFAKIERNMPELERCYKISKKAAKVGFEWPDFNGVIDKVREEVNEVETADDINLEAELGDVLFAAVNMCRYAHIKPQDALQHANNKFINRFNLVCKLAKQQNLELESLTDSQWDNFWIQAKKCFPN